MNRGEQTWGHLKMGKTLRYWLFLPFKQHYARISIEKLRTKRLNYNGGAPSPVTHERGAWLRLGDNPTCPTLNPAMSRGDRFKQFQRKNAAFFFDSIMRTSAILYEIDLSWHSLSVMCPSLTFIEIFHFSQNTTP